MRKAGSSARQCLLSAAHCRLTPGDQGLLRKLNAAGIEMTKSLNMRIATGGHDVKGKAADCICLNASPHVAASLS